MHALTTGQTPFTPPSVKPTGGKKRNTKTGAAKESSAITKKSNNRTIPAKASANGNKRNPKAKADATSADKVKKSRAQPGTSGTRRKQKVGNMVDNSDVIDVSIANENSSMSQSDLSQLREEPATQSFSSEQQQLHLLPPFETQSHPRHGQLGANRQQVPYQMVHQQGSADIFAQHRSFNPPQLPVPTINHQGPMHPQQWTMPPSQRTVPAPQPTSNIIAQSPSSRMLPQQHLPSILSQQPSTPPHQSLSDDFSQQLPLDMPSQQEPQPPRSPPVSVTSEDQRLHSHQDLPDMLPLQHLVQSHQESTNMSTPHYVMPLKQLPLNMTPQQHAVSMKIQRPESALEPQRPTPAVDLQQPPSDMHSLRTAYIPIERYIGKKLDMDALDNAGSADFDQLILNMIKQNPTLSPEHNVNAVTSDQLDQCAYVLWEGCLWFNGGKLVVQAAKYGSMYQDVKICALGMMNLLPGWWFIREKIKQWLEISHK